MKQIVLAILAISVAFTARAHACSCVPEGGGFLEWEGNEVPSNLASFPWYGGEPTDGAWLPPNSAFHLERLRAGEPSQPLAVSLERSDSVFPDRTIPDFLAGQSTIRDGLLHTVDRKGQDMVWPRPVLVVVKPLVRLVPGATYRIVYEREPAPSMFGEPGRAEPPQKITFKVLSARIPAVEPGAALVVGEQKVGGLRVSTRKGSCSTEITAASRPLELRLPPGLAKWRQFFLYSTLVDGRGWRPSPTICDNVPHGMSWVGPGRELIYATCGGGTPSDSLAEGEHTVEVVAWLPGTPTLIRASNKVALSCGRRPTSR